MFLLFVAAPWGVRLNKMAFKAVREYTRAIDKPVNDKIPNK